MKGPRNPQAKPCKMAKPTSIATPVAQVSISSPTECNTMQPAATIRLLKRSPIVMPMSTPPICETVIRPITIEACATV